jgi:hypothetical protein
MTTLKIDRQVSVNPLKHSGNDTYLLHLSALLFRP